jgi:hypothetical protein
VLDVDLTCELVNPDIVFRSQTYTATNRFFLLGLENNNTEGYFSNDAAGTAIHLDRQVNEGVTTDVETEIPALGFTDISLSSSLALAMDCPDGLGGTISTSVSGASATTTSASVSNSVATFTGNFTTSFSRTKVLCGNLYNRVGGAAIFTFDLKKTATLEANFTCDGTFTPSVRGGIIQLRQGTNGPTIFNSNTVGCAVNVPIPAGRYVFTSNNINHNGSGLIGSEGGSSTLTGNYEMVITIDP